MLRWGEEGHAAGLLQSFALGVFVEMKTDMLWSLAFAVLKKGDLFADLAVFDVVCFASFADPTPGSLKMAGEVSTNFILCVFACLGKSALVLQTSRTRPSDYTDASVSS